MVNVIEEQITRHQDFDPRPGLGKFRRPSPEPHDQLEGADAFGGGVARKGPQSTHALGVSTVTA